MIPRLELRKMAAPMASHYHKYFLLLHSFAMIRFAQSVAAAVENGVGGKQEVFF